MVESSIWAMRTRAPGWVGWVRDLFILPSGHGDYLASQANPYKPTRIPWKTPEVFCARLAWCLMGPSMAGSDKDLKDAGGTHAYVDICICIYVAHI